MQKRNTKCAQNIQFYCSYACISKKHYVYKLLNCLQITRFAMKFCYKDKQIFIKYKIKRTSYEVLSLNFNTTMQSRA